MRFKTLLCSVFLMSAAASVAQPAFSVFLGGGGMYYYGDLNARLITHPKSIDGALFTGVNLELNKLFRFKIKYLHGSISAADSLSNVTSHFNRNLSFTSKIDELSGLLVFRILGQEGYEVSYPYFFGGLGYYHFNPKAMLNGQLYELQPLGTEGQNFTEGNNPAPYERTQWSVPFGGGLSFQLGKKIDLNVEATYHYLFTDYLDDVSTRYPDSSSLASTKNGSLAVLFASRNRSNFQSTTSPRGGAKYKDSFVHFGASLSYYPGKRATYGKGLRRIKCNKF
jgi:hypothetical protein